MATRNDENALDEAARITGAQLHARVLAGNHLLRFEEVASLLSCSTRTVRSKVQAGEISEVRIGDGQRDRRISMLALAEFIRARTEAAA